MFTRNEIVTWGVWQVTVIDQVQSSLVVQLQPLKQKVLIIKSNTDIRTLFSQKAFPILYRPDRIENVLMIASWDRRLLWYEHLFSLLELLTTDVHKEKKKKLYTTEVHVSVVC